MLLVKSGFARLGRTWLRKNCSWIGIPALIAVAFLSGRDSQAYPQYIGYGYSSCLNCHYSPVGDGPLTDYGRALGASTLAGRPPFVSKYVTDEKLAEYSGFLGKVENLPDWIRPGFSYRGLSLLSPLENHPRNLWLNMQADLSLALQFMDQKLYFVGMAGYLPTLQTQPLTSLGGSTNSHFISRELYGGYLLSDAVGLYAGVMDPAFGIHVPDHYAYLRSETLLNDDDQVMGAMVHVTLPSFEGSLQGMLGSPLVTPTIRQKGVTAMGEYALTKYALLGASAWYTSSDVLMREQAAIHARLGFPEGNALLAEFGLIGNHPVNDVSQTGAFYFLQSYVLLTRGLNFLTTLEFYTNEFFGSAPRDYQFGPSLQWLPFQRLELRVDLLGGRVLSPSLSPADTFTLQSQVHVWL